MPPPQQTKTVGRDVLLFVPNWIGYFRVGCSLTSFLLMMAFPKQWLLAIVLYLLNFIGDLFDGLVARKLNQCSSFGGILDMLTDRCSTAGLLMILSVEYIPVDEALSFPFFRIAFLLLVLLDVSSHWMQTYSVLATGHHHKSKEGNEGRNILVQWFYAYYWFFGYLCVGAEFTYMILYARNHVKDTPVILQKGLDTFLAVCIPACLAKQVVNTAQLLSACQAIANYDAEQINAARTKKQ